MVYRLQELPQRNLLSILLRRRRDPRDLSPRRDSGRRHDYNRGPPRRQPRKEQPPRPPNRSLFVRPIDPTITQEILGNHFQKYGKRELHFLFSNLF